MQMQLMPANTTTTHSSSIPSHWRNREKLETQLLDYYKASTFDTFEQQPLSLVTGPPLRIMMDPNARPVASHTLLQGEVKVGTTQSHWASPRRTFLSPNPKWPCCQRNQSHTVIVPSSTGDPITHLKPSLGHGMGTTASPYMGMTATSPRSSHHGVTIATVFPLEVTSTTKSPSYSEIHKIKASCLATDWSKDGLGFWLFQKHCSCSSTKLFCCNDGWRSLLLESLYLWWWIPLCPSRYMGDDP